MSTYDPTIWLENQRASSSEAKALEDKAQEAFAKLTYDSPASEVNDAIHLRNAYINYVYGKRCVRIPKVGYPDICLNYTYDFSGNRRIKVSYSNV